MEQYQQSPDAQLKAQTLWYMALVNIKLNNKELAEKQLQELLQLGSFKTKTTKTLLKDL